MPRQGLLRICRYVSGETPGYRGLCAAFRPRSRPLAIKPGRKSVTRSALVYIRLQWREAGNAQQRRAFAAQAACQQFRTGSQTGAAVLDLQGVKPCLSCPAMRR